MARASAVGELPGGRKRLNWMDKDVNTEVKGTQPFNPINAIVCLASDMERAGTSRVLAMDSSIDMAA